jgi:hypothetical protein
MLHLIYIFAFTIIAFLTITNLIRSLITVSMDSQRSYSHGKGNRYGSKGVPHPELLDDSGMPIDEPLLVMRSVNVEDARQQLDALYQASPSQMIDVDEEK